MGWLIAYDIADPRRWRKIYHRVQQDCARVQYSLFYGDLSRPEIDSLHADLARLIAQGEDDVRMYFLAEDAWLCLRGRPILPEGVQDDALARLVARSHKSGSGG